MVEEIKVMVTRGISEVVKQWLFPKLVVFTEQKNLFVLFIIAPV
jgi:hypothetical protein